MSIFTGKIAIFGAVAAASLVASAPAGAATFDLGTFSSVGLTSRTFGNSSTLPGSINDSFTFTTTTGGASGSVISVGGVADITLTSVTLDGVNFSKLFDPTGFAEVFTLSLTQLSAGLHTIKVLGTWQDAPGTTNDGGSYSGQVDFRAAVVPAVPEPAAWGMMLLGFGFAGAAMRYGRRKTKVSYA